MSVHGIVTRLNEVQRSKLALRIGKRTSLDVDVAITSVGLLAIGALVSMILLSSAVIVKAARPGNRQSGVDS